MYIQIALFSFHLGKHDMYIYTLILVSNIC